MSDPLPQAMILTAIVITLGMAAFLLTLAYRSWQLLGHDEVQDDVEDRRIMQRGRAGCRAQTLPTRPARRHGRGGRRVRRRGGRAVTFLVPLPVVLPLFGAGADAADGHAGPAQQRAVSVTVLIATLVVSLRRCSPRPPRTGRRSCRSAAGRRPWGSSWSPTSWRR